MDKSSCLIFAALYYRPVGVTVYDNKIIHTSVVEVIGAYELEWVGGWGGGCRRGLRLRWCHSVAVVAGFSCGVDRRCYTRPEHSRFGTGIHGSGALVCRMEDGQDMAS